jgi:3-dehydroquinate synthase
MRKIIKVDTSVPYEVIVGNGVSEGVGEWIKSAMPKVFKVMIVSDETVAALYLVKIRSLITDKGLSAYSFVFPAGEKSKNLSTYSRLIEALAAAKLTRDDLVVALGGGVTGDMAGFGAATYLRGLDFIQIPTSLLAMVDSSVGGKTGVDISAGKNLVGAFHQPRRVFCDLDFLKTLPPEWVHDGMGEVLKYAVMGDGHLFERLESEESVFPDQEMISRSIALKRDIVCRDEKESSVRKFLNLGHTFAHAIEVLSEYKIHHGSAVATGVAMASDLAFKKGILSLSDCDRITNLVSKMGYAVITDFPKEDLLKVMLNDKKCSGDLISLVLPKKIGEVVILSEPVKYGIIPKNNQITRS